MSSHKPLGAPRKGPKGYVFTSFLLASPLLIHTPTSTLAFDGQHRDPRYYYQQQQRTRTGLGVARCAKVLACVYS